MNNVAARLGQHVVEIMVPSDECHIKTVGRNVALRVTIRTAQGIHDALKGLEPTLQPFEEIDKTS